MRGVFSICQLSSNIKLKGADGGGHACALFPQSILLLVCVLLKLIPSAWSLYEMC